MKTQVKQLAMDTIKRRILSLQLGPGEVIDELALSEEFEISRTPMREIIQKLAGEGYLQQHENRGASVMPMNFEMLRHFFISAPMIYAATGHLAAENWSGQQLELLKEIQVACKKAFEDDDVFAATMQNHNFHQQIGVMGGSTYLMPSLLRLLIDHTRIAQSFFVSSHAGLKRERAAAWEALEHHDQMIDALSRRDAEDVIRLTHIHWDLSRDRLQEFVRSEPLDHQINTVGLTA